MSATMLINKFKEYIPSEREIIGTVASMIPNGKLKLIPNTVEKYENGVNKAIGIILINSAGESTTLPCSKAVSKAVVEALNAGENKKDVLAIIAKLEITQFVHKTTGEICQVVAAPISYGDEEEISTDFALESVKSYSDLG
jgi:hypothetical protein